LRRKAQYEKKFKDWGFQKHRTKQDWKVMGQKLGARKRMAKESNVYLDGQLVPAKKVRKEISRQAYMTVSEQFHQAQGKRWNDKFISTLNNTYQNLLLTRPPGLRSAHLSLYHYSELSSRTFPFFDFKR
jgi:post-segregation antitoxin (ccd killing protein)